MVLFTNRGPIRRNDKGRRSSLGVALLGILCLIIPVILMVIDPILLIVKYKLRVAEGTMIHDLLTHELKGVYLSVYIYNVTNAHAFMAGDDDKLKLEEVGPFTYQEYRNNENVTIDAEAGVVRYWSRMRAEFIREKSIGYPEDMTLTIPNLPLLGTTNIIAKYPFLKGVFNILVRRVNSQPLITVSAYEYLWGYKEPLVDIAKTLLPGLVYYDRIGLLDRLFDQKAEFYVEMGGRDEDKFLVKSVKKFTRVNVWDDDDIDESIQVFNNSYEGAAYPPELTPSTPINMYRLGLCKTMGLQYTGTKPTKFGTAFTYTFRNESFNDTLCDSKGYCPEGMIDISGCYFGCPFAITRSHLLHMDPKLFERIEAVPPDEIKDSTEFVIEPRMRLTLEASISLQVNMLLGDVKYISRLRPFADLFVPLAYVKAKHPELPPVTKHYLYLMYVLGPQLLLAFQVILFLLSFCLLSYSLKLFFYNSTSNNSIEYSPPSELPLDKS